LHVRYNTCKYCIKTPSESRGVGLLLKLFTIGLSKESYEAATISRLPENIGFFCKRAL